jgi:5'-methylthioadenosine phosphorylase
LSDDNDSYALIATVTDYDAWRPNSEAVTAAEVFKTLRENAETSHHVAGTILQELHAAVLQGDILSEEAGSMQSAIMPRSEQQTQADRDRLRYVLPTYFSDPNP